ncbi:peptidoglycan-associated lipoprotein [Amaricoccus solimangrovi]|uniref:Peptidoglycan-associated lipoprotein n=2 Tax=Amaricoccus solimangrovi TaxID=2589815 RepID=A0A501WZ18_9RHOB|nr:peptidoglycan-associated lipoprotein [Amaricoccus solimangrovi]
MRGGILSGGLLAAALALAGCAGEPISVPTSPDAGYNGLGGAGGAGGLGLDGVSGGALGGGTLPGTSISDRVFFTVDQSTLSAEAIGTLNQQIGWLTQNQGQITIEGHADERGTRDYNFQLGSARASAVRNYMVSQGIPDSRISIITFGRERPVATCAEESCFARNRRAVTVVARPGA